MRLIILICFVLLAFYAYDAQAQTTAGAVAGAYLEWLEMQAFQGTQILALPRRAATIGGFAEFGTTPGFNFRFSAGRGIGLDGPPLTLTRYDTSVLYIFPLDNIKLFGDVGSGLLQFDSSGTQFWRAVGWAGVGLRVSAFRIFMVAFEIKRMFLIQLDNRIAPIPGTWVYRLEFLVGGI